MTAYLRLHVQKKVCSGCNEEKSNQLWLCLTDLPVSTKAKSFIRNLVSKMMFCQDCAKQIQLAHTKA